MSILTYNGSAIIAMAGKDCVAIGSDLRFGVQFQTLATDCQKVYRMNDKLFLGLAGLGTDAQTLSELLKFRHNMYKLREERDMSPQAFAHMVSSVLYGRRFGPYFCEPVIAGLDKDDKPFITGMDSLGAMETSPDFMCAGTAPDSMWGMCESMFKKDMEPEDLFETISQCLLTGVDRDAMSGWGAVVYVITKDKVVARTLRGRMD
ncbi:unnamed protein product [Pedinophyceae sp. YPF-701]|nr:unnamed protein product [Pedinophyceae sp. YPF-701]